MVWAEGRADEIGEDSGSGAVRSSYIVRPDVYLLHNCTGKIKILKGQKIEIASCSMLPDFNNILR